MTNPGAVLQNLIQPVADDVCLTLRPFSDAQVNPTLRVQNAPGSVDWLQVLPSKTVAIGSGFTPDSTQNIDSFGPVSIHGIADPNAPAITNIGAPGTTGYDYAIVAKLANGLRSNVSFDGSTATGNATLDNINFNRISWTAVPGASSYDVINDDTGGTVALSVVGLTTDDHGGVQPAYSYPETNFTGLLSVDRINAKGKGVDSQQVGFTANSRGDRSVSFGNQSVASEDAVALGYLSQALNARTTCAGKGTVCSNINSLAAGYSTLVFGDRGIGIGYGVEIDHPDCIVIASTLSGVLPFPVHLATTAPNQLLLGGDIRDCYVGRGVTNPAPQAVTWQPTGASGANVVGANMRLAGGKSTGSAKGGDVLIQTSPAGGAGSSLNALAALAAFTGDSKIGVFSQAGTPVVQQANASQAGINSLAGAVYATDAAAIKAALQAIYTALANIGWCAATA